MLFQVILAVGMGAATATTIEPSPELKGLEEVLVRAQEARQDGRLKPDRFERFLVEFRISLRQTVERIPDSPPNAALHARILARLGDGEEAIASIGTALERAPENPDLLATQGFLRFEKGDYAGALESANAALAQNPGHPVALTVKKLSEGRESTHGQETLAHPASQAVTESSLLSDSRIVAAAGQAKARQDASRYVDDSMRLLRIGDPRAALRYLSLAEASDPTLPDVPMQQGIAHGTLKEHAIAAERFAAAESLWKTRKTADGDRLAELARQGKERESALITAAEPDAQPTPQAPTRRWPLVPAGAGLTTLGFGWGLKKRRDDESLLSPTVMTTIGVGLLAASTLFPPAAPALAPAAGPAIGASLAPAMAGTAGSLLTALGIKRQAEEYYHRANDSQEGTDSSAQKSGAPARGLAPEGTRPPGHDSSWQIRPASRPSEVAKGGMSYWDPKGGEWRYFPEDKYHYAHWDYNPHTSPNSPWQNIALRIGDVIYKAIK